MYDCTAKCIQSNPPWFVYFVSLIIFNVRFKGYFVGFTPNLSIGFGFQKFY